MDFNFCETKLIPMAQLELDPRFNRDLIPRTIQLIDADPDPDKFGVLQVTKLNGNGKFTVYDGGHRYMFLSNAGYEGDVPCVVGRISDPHVLARKFVDLNLDRRPVNPWERFRKLLFAEDPEMLAIDRAVRAVEWSVGPKAIPYIVTPAPMEWLYKSGQENALNLTLDLAHDAWDGRNKSTDPNLLKGLWTVVANPGAGFDRDRFVDRLSMSEPFDLLLNAQERRARERGSLYKNVGREIVRVYRQRKAAAA